MTPAGMENGMIWELSNQFTPNIDIRTVELVS